MDGNNHQGSDSEYVSQYDDDEEFGHIRRSRRLRLRFNRPGQARMRCIDPSEEDEEEGNG